jgi:hypothetical protein
MTKDVLNHMEIKWDDIFTPYHFQFTTIGGETVWKTLNRKELFAFVKAYITFIIDKSHGSKITMLEFCTENAFSDNAKEMIDRICRLTDGAPIEKYTLREFICLFDQEVFYKLYQPKAPNDTHLFRKWKNYLENTGLVGFQTNTTVTDIQMNANTVTSIATQTQQRIDAKAFVFAIPPQSLVKINNSSLVFGSNLQKFANDTKYLEYISLTLHYKTQLSLPKVYGFPKSSWGVAYVQTTDFTKLEETSSQTVLSVTLTKPDAVSKYSNKRAQECTSNELTNDILQQLRESFPYLSDPDIIVYNPIKSDTAFVGTTHGYMDFQSPVANNAYTLGTHNGAHLYQFTSMESAVTNAIALGHHLFPSSKVTFPIHSCISFRTVILCLLFVCIILLFFRNRHGRR